MTSDNPPYFQVGTNVSAKYKGAFCSANVKKVKRKVKVKVQFPGKPRPKFRLILDDEVFGPLFVNSKVRAMDPEVGGLVDATVVQVIDRSVYTVVFNDGDVSTLSRSGVCTPGKRHYNAKDSLDNFPLLDPKEFSSPVLAGSQQVPTDRASRRLPRTQTSDNVTAGPSTQSDTSNVTPEEPGSEVASGVVRSCRQKTAVPSSSSGSLPMTANRPKFTQRKKNPTTKKTPSGKHIRRKVLGFKKNGRSSRKMNASGTASKAKCYGPSKKGQPKKTLLTEPAILEVIDGIQQGMHENSRKIPAAGVSILRLPVSEGQQVESTEFPESLHARSLTRDGNVSKQKHDSIDGYDQGITERPQEDCRPCCSKDLRKVDSVNHRRNTRANAARAFPKTVNEMYKELSVIVDEKRVEIPMTPPIGKRFNFVPENLELVTDPIERQRLIMASLENLCVTYFGIKEQLNAMEQRTSKPKKK